MTTRISICFDVHVTDTQDAITLAQHIYLGLALTQPVLRGHTTVIQPLDETGRIAGRATMLEWDPRKGVPA